MRHVCIAAVLALMAGGCHRESFDDQWQHKSEEANKTANAMERDMQTRMRVAQQAGHDLASSAVEAGASGP